MQSETAQIGLENKAGKTPKSELYYNRILGNNSTVVPAEVRSVLVVYEPDAFFIGDSVISMNHLDVCALYFPNAILEINVTDRYKEKLKALVGGNSAIDKLTSLPLEKIEYPSYDVVICVTYREGWLLLHLVRNYGELFESCDFRTALFSNSAQMLRPRESADIIFPINEGLFQCAAEKLVDRPRELAIKDDERTWGDNWLRSNGMLDHEQLFILVDSAMSRHKMLKMEVYFDIVAFLLTIPNSRILIFDEKGVGKDEFYEEWLDGSDTDRIIFSKNLSLRADLCLIGSNFTRLVFGPCTGLMHCASGIYNYLKRTKGDVAVPFLLTYTGKYNRVGERAETWWANSPLMNCLVPYETDGTLKVSLLTEVWGNDNIGVVECNAYTAEILKPYLIRGTSSEIVQTRSDIKK